MTRETFEPHQAPSPPRMKTLLEIHTEELLAPLPETWKICVLRALDNGFLLEGSLTTVYKTGPRKGQTKWLSEGKKSCVIPYAQHEAWLSAWEAKTGLCRHCVGSARTCVRVDCSGSYYRPCQHCKGTGKAQ